MNRNWKQMTANMLVLVSLASHSAMAAGNKGSQGGQQQAKGLNQGAVRSAQVTRPIANTQTKIAVGSGGGSLRNLPGRVSVPKTPFTPVTLGKPPVKVLPVSGFPVNPRPNVGPFKPIIPVKPPTVSPFPPIGPIGPVKPPVVVGPRQPINPIGPIGPVKPPIVVGPRQPISPIGPIGPVQPPIVVGPRQPINPIGPIGPIRPPVINPFPPIGPIGPVQPPVVGPLPPIGPIGPINPPVVNPLPPIGPVNPPVVGPLPPIGPLPPFPPINPNPPMPPLPPVNPPHHDHCHPHWDCWTGWVGGWIHCPIIQPCPLPVVSIVEVVPVQTTVVVQEIVPVALPVRREIDLAVKEVRVVEKGNAERGPLYRVFIANKSLNDLDVPTRVALLGVNGEQPTDDTPRAIETLMSLKSGETVAMDVRLPVTAAAYPLLLVVVEVPETFVDTNEQDNLAQGEVARLPLAVAAVR